MDDYPIDYTSSNYPLVVLSGVESSHTEPTARPSFWRNGYRLHSECLPVSWNRVDQLKRAFLAHGIKDDPSKSNISAEFRFHACGREYWLPSRKSVQSPVLIDGAPSFPSRVLHSPLSPLSPGSPLYPDGLVTPLWACKHQHVVPAMFICFFEFNSDPRKNLISDDQLKKEINLIKMALANSKYKTRFSVVLLSESASLESTEHDERLEIIRRSAGLDAKNSFFVLPVNASTTELSAFVATVLAAITPLCAEYYRDLTRHARRKKNRGPGPISSNLPGMDARYALPFSGWMLRYEYKLGFFAEFRGDLDIATQHYTNVLDTMLQSQGILDGVPRVASRWVEARILADTVAIRTIRCLLRSKMTNAAVSSWINYRHRIRGVIDRRGKSISDYAWHAWQARWAKIMALLVQNSSLWSNVGASERVYHLQSPLGGSYLTSASPISGEDRNFPWECLHHPGYWLALSIKHMQHRKLEASRIPNEDRVSPDQATASNISRRAESYDTYLCPEPHIESPATGSGGFDHSHEIILTQDLAIREFHAMHQSRMADILVVARAAESLSASRAGYALDILLPIWKSNKWRNAKWWDLLGSLTWTLHQCAVATGNINLQIATLWELCSDVFVAREGITYDIMDSLHKANLNNDQMLSNHIAIDSDAVVSFVEIATSFRDSEGHMGEATWFQIQVRSTAHRHSATVKVSKVIIDFDGPLQTLEICHRDRQSDARHVIQIMTFTEIPTTPDAKKILRTDADLTLKPNQLLILQGMVTFRDTGKIRGSKATLLIESDNICICYQHTLQVKNPLFWWSESLPVATSRRVTSLDPGSIIVLPKPPKVKIIFPDIQHNYYTDERILLEIDLFNGENENIQANLELRLLGDWEHGPTFHWTKMDEIDHQMQIITQSPSLVIGEILAKAGSRHSVSIHLGAAPITIVVEVKVLYRLISDQETPISKTATASFDVIGPFEANYKFLPCLNPSPWPSYFDTAGIEFEHQAVSPFPSGASLTWKWALSASMVSFALEPLIVHSIDIVLRKPVIGAICIITRESESSGRQKVAPGEQIQHGFILDMQNPNFTDHDGLGIEFDLKVSWSRESTADDKNALIESLLGVPRLIVVTNEPRVLATHLQSASEAGLIYIDCILENLSMHFLSFSVSMESSDEFAFSGPRLTTVNVTPLSRFGFRYTLLPNVQGQYISPKIKVIDRYFTKTLQIYPTKPLDADSKGLLIWVDAEED